MLYYINILIIFIKYVFIHFNILTLSLNVNVLTVLIVNFILLSVIKLLYKINIKFVQILNKPLVTLIDKIKNIIIIIFFILFYFFGILYLRFLNINMKLDLLLLSNQTMSFIELYGYYGWIIFILFVFFIAEIIFIFTLITKILRDFFKFNVIKRHIYNFYKGGIHNYDSHEKWEITYAYHIEKLKLFTIEELQHKILYSVNKKIKKSYYYMGLSEDLHKIIPFILYKGHYFILCLVFIYDVIINKGVITHVFPLLLYIFIYETILKISNFITHIFLPYDEEIYIFIYEKPKVFVDEITIAVGKNFYKLNTGQLYVMLNIYLRDGLYYDPNKYDYDDLAMDFNYNYTLNPETLQYEKIQRDPSVFYNERTELDERIFRSLFNDLTPEARKNLFDKIFKE